MYKEFILTLANNTSEYDIEFNILTTSIAQRWANEIAKNYNLYEVDRFQGWPNKELSYYVDELKKQINTINSYKYVIDNTRELDQDKLNLLHKFFEELRGPIETGTEFYNNAPTIVQDALMKFNITIHECEHYLRSSNEPTIIGTYSDRPRISLEENDYSYFTFKWEYGTVYINYCEVGKTLLDVFKDKDSVVGVDNIKPLEYYSADFMVKFGRTVPDEFYNQRLLDFQNWYKTTTYNFKQLALGLIPVAKLSTTVTIADLAKYTRIKNTCLK
jgi:hypothetical protein